MSHDAHISVRIQLGEREYPLRVLAYEKELVEQAAAYINEKVEQYRNRYADKDIQDFLAMTALQLATKSIEKQREEQNDELADTLMQLNQQLGDYIESVQRS